MIPATGGEPRAEIAVRDITDAVELHAFAPFFAQAHAARDVAPDFLMLVATQIPGCRGWRVLVAESGGKAMGAVVCRIESRRRPGSLLGPALMLRVILDGVLGVTEARVAEALLDALCRLLPTCGADLLQFDHLPGTGRSGATLSRATPHDASGPCGYGQVARTARPLGGVNSWMAETSVPSSTT